MIRPSRMLNRLQRFIRQHESRKEKATLSTTKGLQKSGTVFIYEGQTKDGFERDEFFVTHKTVKILGVTTIEVHDTVTVDGELTDNARMPSRNRTTAPVAFE
jgi:hypothetical protein